MYRSPITLEALLVLDAIASRGSFAGAAEQLNKVPSALSYIVQKLEQQLEVSLFVRQGRRSVLTPSGRHLLAEGRKLLGAVNKITEQTQTIAHGWEPKIRIAFDSILNVRQLLKPLAQFLTEYPNIEIDLSEEVMNGSWEALAEDRVDLLVGAPGPVPNQKGIRAEPMGQINLALVVAKDHPLASATPPVNKADIQHYRTIIVHDSAKNDVPWSSNIIEHSRHFFVRSMEHKVQAIIAGIGVGFLPRQRMQPYLDDSSLVEVALQEGVESEAVFMAYKMVNKGKGLQRLREIIGAELI